MWQKFSNISPRKNTFQNIYLTLFLERKYDATGAQPGIFRGRGAFLE